jgi:RNA polymerase sigma-70 factor, ECF subfamily
MSESQGGDDASDRELIERWRRGEQRAATELVARHADALARFAVARGERRDVEELVQDTFVRAFASLDSFRGDSSLRTWLFTIERRLMLDRRRAEKRGRGSVEIQEGDVSTEYDALDSVVAGETEGQLREAITRLSPTQREVFALRVGEGMSYKEIADAVGTTEGAARVHYHNAMRAVKEFLT